MSAAHEPGYGGSAAAIEHHYDVGNDFYATWLDPTMTYSCAMWDGLAPDAPLEAAQRRKLAFHAEAAGARPGARMLDVGCGWGAMMRAMIDDFGAAQCVGLTLSREQARHIAGMGRPEIDVRLENWSDFRPDRPFDGVVSIGAFEHFARPDQDRDTRRAIYRAFFAACRDWTEGRGRLSLQTIAYGTMTPDESNPFISSQIFPDAELPTLEDIVVASSGLFRIVRLRDDGPDYARTCEIWAKSLRAAARDGRVSASAEVIERYYRYLRLSAAGFRMGRIGLLRIGFEPLGWHTVRTD